MPPPTCPATPPPARLARGGLILPRPILPIPALLLGALLLGGCEIGPMLAMTAGPSLVTNGAALVLTGRTPLDHVASLVTGRDCSVVRVERREGWCAPLSVPPPPAAYCTRSLGSTDCWTTRPVNAGRQMADPPQP